MFGHQEVSQVDPCLRPHRLAPPVSATELAERQLRSSPYLALRNITCDSQGGVLVLRGFLPSYYLKQMAQAVVTCVDGVEQVVNQIEVVTGPGAASRRW